MLRVTEFCNLSKSNIEATLADLRGFGEDYNKKANLGTLWHSWILRGGDKESAPANIEIIKALDYRSKESRVARDNALKEGKTPILGRELAEFNIGFSFLKKALFDIFPSDAEFEKEFKGYVEGVDLVGHIDCLTKNKVIDLKISEVGRDLNKHIFDMRYNLQVYLYMILSDKPMAELVFVNPKALIIQSKTLLRDELKAECDALIERAFANMDMINKALSEPLVLRSDYVIPQFALVNLS